ncbi:MAG: type II toxin-antitoxin system RelE/ParE family toxin [Nitrococcus sp.]|nr:type II toxin-antitoxin system RelE/ParE family toxin [Nitrococcus sp.]
MEELIRSKVRALAACPYAPNNNAEPLNGSRYYRLRVGGWRVIYDIHDDELVMVVLTVRPRGGVYR